MTIEQFIELLKNLPKNCVVIDSTVDIFDSSARGTLDDHLKKYDGCKYGTIRIVMPKK